MSSKKNAEPYAEFDSDVIEQLEKYYRNHDFTNNIPSFDDRKYSQNQVRIYVKAKEFFALSWLSQLPAFGNKRSMKNYSKNYLLNCLKEGDAAFIADKTAEIYGDAEKFKEAIDYFFSVMEEGLTIGFTACAASKGKTPDELTDEEIHDVVDKVAELYMNEMIHALMIAQLVGRIYKVLSTGDDKLEAHEDFNESRLENHDKINFDKHWTHSDTALGAPLMFGELSQADTEALEAARSIFDTGDSEEDTEKQYLELRNGFLDTLSREDQQIFEMREEGKTQNDIAKVLGFKTHSAITKHLQAMREQFEEYMKNYR